MELPRIVLETPRYRMVEDRVWYGRELLRVEPPAERRPSRSGMH